MPVGVLLLVIDLRTLDLDVVEHDKPWVSTDYFISVIGDAGDGISGQDQLLEVPESGSPCIQASQFVDHVSFQTEVLDVRKGEA